MFSFKDFVNLFRENSILTDYDRLCNAEIGYISYNSRDVKENTLFFCK
ncbi:MAG: hypothetical protein ACI4SX_02035 [Candidatus Fimenecus sp.]